MDYLTISLLCITTSETTIIPIIKTMMVMMMPCPSPPVLPLVMDDRTNIVISGGSRIR